jgi:hypothetical protein
VVRLAVKSKGAEKPAPKGRKSKPAKDPNKPKRAPSAFFVFMYRSIPFCFLLITFRDFRAAVLIWWRLCLFVC